MAWPLTAATTGRSRPYQPANSRLMPVTTSRCSSGLSVGTTLRSIPAEKNCPGR